MDCSVNDYESINKDLSGRASGWVAVKPIRSEIDYAEVLQEVERLQGATDGSPEADLLTVLVALASAWEADQAER